MRRLLLLVLWFLAGCTPELPELAPLPTLAPLPEEVLSLAFWQTQSDTLSSTNPISYWQFAGEAGDEIFIRAIPRNLALTLTLLQGETILAQGTESLELRLPDSALYRVRVDHVSGDGTYDIGLGYTDRPNPDDTPATDLPQVVGVPTPTPPFSSLGEFIDTLSEGREVAQLLSANSPQHIYTLQGEQGMVVTFELYRIAGTFDPLLRLYDRNGELIAMDDDSLGDNNARLLNIRLPEEGLYTVQVDGQGLFGDYTLIYLDEAQNITPDTPPTVAPTQVAPYATPMTRFAVPDQRLDDHHPAINNLERTSDFQRFSFFAEAGERISLAVEPLDGAALMPQFEVFDPDGAQIAFASSAGRADRTALANGIIVAQTGAHTIIVTSDGSTSGQFVIAFGRGASVRDVYQGIAFSNNRTQGRIERAGTRHIWQLDLDPGDVVTIAVSPDEQLLNPVIELVTVEGDVLYRDDDGGNGNAALINLARIDTPATYLLRVYDETGTQTGAYTLLWNLVEQAPTPSPIPAQVLILQASGQVDEGQYQFYAFQGQAGQRVQVQAVADDAGFDPVLALIDPQGTIIAEADDSDGTLNPRTTLTLPADGTYQVRVNGYLSQGAFTTRVAILFD
ncbi:MAG: PPC domain-containing protein [Anaerolineae bacterium]